MIQPLVKNSFYLLRRSCLINTVLSNKKAQKISTMTIHQGFATKKKKVIELNSQKISLQYLNTQNSNLQTQTEKQSYLELKQKISSLPWQQMPFDKLCALDQQILDVLQIDLKKDKFNISDQEFLKSELKNVIPISYNQLSPHYKKIHSLLMNTNDYFDQFPSVRQIKKGYLNEMYVTDLKNDRQLLFAIARFIKHIAKPHKLEAIAEPTFVKKLLALKRQLMLQGIHFQTKAEKKQTQKKGQKLMSSNDNDQLPQIKILQILNYEYEFWQDVKHNRAKNGSEEDFIIESKEVPNFNQSILLKELYPTIKIKYIARRRALKVRQRGFCIKADLLIEINKNLKRKIKVEWKGPSTNVTLQKKSVTKNKNNDYQNEEEESEPKMNYLVIDYEGLCDGNPTIRPIFNF